MMSFNILIIADDPSSPTFRSIDHLKKEIMAEKKSNIDLLTISNGDIRFNEKQQRVEKDVTTGIRKIIEQKTNSIKYNLIIISLSKGNLIRILSGKEAVLDFLIRTSLKVAVFIFGSSSLFSLIKQFPENHVVICPRPGVSKITINFKNKILDYIAKC